MPELKFKEESYRIVGACFEVYNEMGAGFLDVYELKWEGQEKPIRLYVNIYERGYLLVPLGLSIKK